MGTVHFSLNKDKIGLHFKSLITHHIGPEFARFIHMKIITINEYTVLVIECERVRKPISLKVGKVQISLFDQALPT